VIDVLDRVARALADSAPVVALETTIITHGLPYPTNIEAARRVEQAIGEEGAVPATIGVVRGRVRVGLSADALESLARGPADKIQARSLALALQRQSTGGTTVSATMEIARHCGIPVFATGGIGGVHRDVERTGDISEDLHALARCPVAVVSSGAKAILDLPRTVEALETLGVPVVGYQTEGFPAFYHPGSSLEIPRVDGVAEIAGLMLHTWQTLRLCKGVLVCNPPPAEVELPPAQVAGWIDQALAEAVDRGITGKAVTPFLLAFLDRASRGATVRTNVALAESNARLASRIAVAYCRRMQESRSRRPS
jgi:pseudouridine-5'-phosphate glycosidase